MGRRKTNRNWRYADHKFGVVVDYHGSPYYCKSIVSLLGSLVCRIPQEIACLGRTQTTEGRQQLLCASCLGSFTHIAIEIIIYQIVTFVSNPSSV